jgi:hypothetical protein
MPGPATYHVPAQGLNVRRPATPHLSSCGGRPELEIVEYDDSTVYHQSPMKRDPRAKRTPGFRYTTPVTKPSDIIDVEQSPGPGAYLPHPSFTGAITAHKTQKPARMRRPSTARRATSTSAVKIAPASNTVAISKRLTTIRPSTSSKIRLVQDRKRQLMKSAARKREEKRKEREFFYHRKRLLLRVMSVFGVQYRLMLNARKVIAARHEEIVQHKAASTIVKAWRESCMRRQLRQRVLALHVALAGRWLKYVVSSRIRRKKRAATLLVAFLSQPQRHESGGLTVSNVLGNLRKKVQVIHDFSRIVLARNHAQRKVGMVQWRKAELSQPGLKHELFALARQQLEARRRHAQLVRGEVPQAMVFASLQVFHRYSHFLCDEEAESDSKAVLSMHAACDCELRARDRTPEQQIEHERNHRREMENAADPAVMDDMNHDYECPMRRQLSMVTDATRRLVLDEYYRQSRRDWWRTYQQHRAVMELYMKRHRDEEVQAIETARFEITGESKTLKSEENSYLAKNPRPILCATIPPAIMQQLIVRGYVQQITRDLQDAEGAYTQASTATNRLH